MSLNFPSSPTVGQVYSYGDKSWVWNGKGWEASASSSPAFAYTATISTPSDTWNITHNLNFYPNIMIQDNFDTILECEVTYNSLNDVTLTFSAPSQGKAHFS